jgi:hypothetical protein
LPFDDDSTVKASIGSPSTPWPSLFFNSSFSVIQAGRHICKKTTTALSDDDLIQIVPDMAAYPLIGDRAWLWIKMILRPWWETA